MCRGSYFGIALLKLLEQHVVAYLFLHIYCYLCRLATLQSPLVAADGYMLCTDPLALCTCCKLHGVFEGSYMKDWLRS